MDPIIKYSTSTQFKKEFPVVCSDVTGQFLNSKSEFFNCQKFVMYFGSISGLWTNHWHMSLWWYFNQQKLPDYLCFCYKAFFFNPHLWVGKKKQYLIKKKKRKNSSHILLNFPTKKKITFYLMRMLIAKPHSNPYLKRLSYPEFQINRRVMCQTWI